MAMASLTLTPPSSKPTTLLPFKPQLSPITSISPAAAAAPPTLSRRELALSLSLSLAATGMFPPSPAVAVENDEYEQETKDVIRKVRDTINMDKSDPNVPAAVAELREASNSWVAKYRREKALLGRSSFRDVYSALNAVSGHYISFGPTAPIPVKRKTRILEEVDTAEKALLRGR